MTKTMVLLLFALFLLSVISWIGDVYGWGLQSLYSAEGIRWTVANLLPNLRRAPLPEVVTAAAGVGVLVESGIFAALWTMARRTVPRLTLKQRRALQFSAVTALALLALLLWLTAFPPYVLLSAFGTFHGSALEQGLPALCCLACACVGMVYGGLSGRFLTMADFLRSCHVWVSRLAAYFVVMLLVAELLGCVDYVIPALGEQQPLRRDIAIVCYGVPLLIQVWAQKRGTART